MDKKRVLVFPAGWENALEVLDALRYNVNVEVFGASSKPDYTEYAYDKDHYILGRYCINEPNFLNEFNEMLFKNSIDVVIPTHDDVALFLADNRNRIEAKVLVSDAETARICRHKIRTYELFEGMDFCPVIYRSREETEQASFPIFMKPDVASGGKDARELRTSDELTDKLFDGECVVSELLPGEELTVDCFTNRHGELVFAGARSRDRIVNGIAFRSTAVELTDEVEHIAKTINDRLNFFGGWYFQVKQDRNGKYRLLEISCRTSCGMTLFRHLGVNFQMMGIFELYGIDTSHILLNSSIQMERRLHTLFHTNIKYDTVYLDYDDTLIVDGKVCDVIIRFIYQCVNNNKRIILLTRHEGDLMDEFERHRLNYKLFDVIIHLTWNDEKKDYIDGLDAILIDNSFAERKKVSEQYGIPVLDVDMVDMLFG